jgi:hypothetical protein
MALAACGGSQSGPRRVREPLAGASARPAGCEVEVVRQGVPSRPTRLLGHAVARCRGDAMTDTARCERQLLDQACGLGATVVWDLMSSTIDDGETLELRAEAAVYR